MQQIVNHQVPNTTTRHLLYLRFPIYETGTHLRLTGLSSSYQDCTHRERKVKEPHLVTQTPCHLLFKHGAIIVVHQEFCSFLTPHLLGAETGGLKGIRIRDSQRKRDLLPVLPGLQVAPDAQTLPTLRIHPGLHCFVTGLQIALGTPACTWVFLLDEICAHGCVSWNRISPQHGDERE